MSEEETKILAAHKKHEEARAMYQKRSDELDSANRALGDAEQVLHDAKHELRRLLNI